MTQPNQSQFTGRNLDGILNFVKAGGWSVLTMEMQFASTSTDQDALPLAPLFAGKGVRNTPLRSKGSQIGKIVCPVTNVVIATEGTTEHNATVCLYADRNIVAVRSQVIRFPYFDKEGVERHHILDLRATRWDGFLYGLIAKTADEAAKKDLPGFVRHIVPQVGSDVANDLRPITNEDMPEWQIRIARMFRKVRTERRTDVDTQIRALAPTITEPIMISELTSQLGGGHIAFRPVVRAIFYGTLKTVTAGFIEPSTLVVFSGCVEPDLDAGRVPDPTISMTLYEAPLQTPKSKRRA